MNCECCGKEKAEAKDYREEGDNIQKYFVCLKCLHLPDDSFKRKRRKTAWGFIAFGDKPF